MTSAHTDLDTSVVSSGGRPCPRRSSSSPLVLEGRSKSEVAHDYDISRHWVQQLVKRYETEGAAAFGPHSRRPHHNPRAQSIPCWKNALCSCARP
jgi:hypothetical protein